MKNREDYQSSSWIKRIRNYEDLKDQVEYWKTECERKDDNIIRQVNEVNTKLDAILFCVNCLIHSETNTTTPNSKKTRKVDKSHTKGVKRENKGKRTQNKKEK